MVRKFQNIAFGYAIPSYSHNIESTLHICVHVYYITIVKTKLQSTMGQQRLNALMLLYIHRDIQINYPKIIDIYANRYPRRMFKNPLAEEQEEKQKSM